MFEPQGPINDVKAWQITAAHIPADPKPIHTTDQKLIGAVLCAIEQATGSQSVAGEITLNEDQVNHVAYLVALELEAAPEDGDRQQHGGDNASSKQGGGESAAPTNTKEKSNGQTAGFCRRLFGG